MKTSVESNEARFGLWAGVALVALHALEKSLWLLLPILASSADGWQLHDIARSLASWRDETSVTLSVPVWYLQYGYFFGIFSAAAWLVTAILLALRKPYALRVLVGFSAFSIVHAIAISLIVLRGDSFTWRELVFYGLLAFIFTRPGVRRLYVRHHA